MPRRFLEVVFGEKDSQSFMSIFTLPDRHVRFFSNFKKATDYILSKPDSNVYIAVGTRSREFVERQFEQMKRGKKPQRGGEQDVDAIYALWADVDVLDPVHKKKNLPPTKEDAKALIKSVGLEPTIIVDSGNGLQAWWCFKEPWYFDEPGEREAAKRLSQRWTATLQSKAAEKGWTVDHTFDLARVLRLPGTYNVKKEEPKPVKIVEIDESRRYDPSEFEPFLVSVPAVAPVAVDAGNLILNPDARPDFDKHEALREVSPEYVKSINRDRKDFTDQSPSAYDMSLASICAAAGWSDQEIVDLLIWARKKNGEDLKLNRPDYYARTIAKARRSAMEKKAEETLEEIASTVEVEGQPDDPEAHRKAVLEALSARLGIGIIRFIKYTSEPGYYRLETTHGMVNLGGISGISNQKTFRDRVADATGIFIPPFKSDKWNRFAQLLLDVREEVDLGSEVTEAGLIRDWINSYLETHQPITDRDAALEVGQPYLESGFCYVSLNSVRRFLVLEYGEKVSLRDLAKMLRPHAEPVTLFYKRRNGRRSSRSLWKLSSEVFEWADPVEEDA